MFRRFSFFMDYIISDVPVSFFPDTVLQSEDSPCDTVVSPLVIALRTDHHLVTKLKAMKIAVMGLLQ